MAVAAAFVAGTMTTGGVVYASFDQCSNDPPQGISDGRPFLEIWQAICDLELQVDQINNEDLQQQIDELKANEILGFYEVVGDSVVISPQSSLGANAVCDDEDIAISGGWNRNNGDMRVNLSLATSINVWGFLFENIDDTNSAEVTPIAICADFDPQHNNAD